MKTLEERVTELEAYAHRHSYDNTIFTFEEEHRERPSLERKESRCSFCSKSKSPTELIAGVVGHICNECVKQCAQIIARRSET